MTSVHIDILDGLSSATAIKGPVLIETTANITLSGEQTINGVAVVDSDRVLVMEQTDPAENGIYVASTGDWRRASDFSRNDDVRSGTLVAVSTSGTLYMAVLVDDFAFDTDDVQFVLFSPSSMVIAATRTTAKALTPVAGTLIYLTEAGREGFFVFRSGNYTSRVAADTLEVATLKADSIAASAGAFVRIVTDGALTPEMAGAQGDGADETSQLQAVIDMALLLGLEARISEKTYIVSGLSIMSNDLTVSGHGSKSKINTNSATGHIFTVGDGISEIRNIVFRDFSVFSTVDKSAGAAFQCRKIARSHWHNVYIGAPEDVVSAANWLWNGIDLDQFDYCHINGGHIITQNEGVACNGSASSGFGAGLWLTGGLKISGQLEVGGAGVHIGGGAGGVYFGDVDILEDYQNVRVSVARQSGVPNREMMFGATCSLDSASTAGLRVEASSLTHLEMAGTWIASAGATFSDRGGIEIESPNSTLVASIVGCRIFNNRGGGIIANAGVLIIDGCAIYANGMGDDVTLVNGRGNGIYFANSNVAASVISNNHISNNGRSAVTAGYGIKIAAGVDNFVIESNIILGNVQGPATITPTLGNTKRVHGNVGYVSEARGTATLAPNGSGEANIAHGLAAAPTFYVVRIIGDTTHEANEVGADATNIVARIRNTTTNADVTAGSFDVMWEAYI